jgi:mannose-1-phosphate guanylyltransferase/mannose-6-phosphate isomerase
MLQNTALRTSGIAGVADPFVVCNEEHRFMVAEQLRCIGVPSATIILEPCGRNTAPAAAVAALEAFAAGDDSLLLVLPADHDVQHVEAFQQAVTAGVPLAAAGKLVTFGIVPTAPETGYGYIKAGKESHALLNEQLTDDQELPTSQTTAFTVDSFVEKPDLTTAERYLASGDYFWNSGMFLFSAKRYLEELQTFAPEMLAACQAAFAAGRRDQDFVRLDKTSFAESPSDSIDYAVMEKTSDAVLVAMMVDADLKMAEREKRANG